MHHAKFAPVQRCIAKTRIIRGGTIEVHVIHYGSLGSLPVEIDNTVDSLWHIHRGHSLIGTVHIEMQRSVVLPHHAHAVADLQSIQILTVLIYHSGAIMHHAVARHHPRARSAKNKSHLRAIT